MKRSIITIILLCFFCSLSAQEDTTKLNTGKRIIIYKTKVLLNNRQHAVKGALFEVNDSSVFVSNSLVRKDYSTGKFELSRINFSNIDLVKIHKKNSVGKGIFIGAVTGYVLGWLIGYSQGDDPPGWVSFSARDKARAGGICMAFGGIGLGALFGSIQLKIRINGSNYNQNRLKKYTIR